MDGKHDKQALVNILLSAIEAGEIYFERPIPGENKQEVITDPKQLKAISIGLVDNVCKLLHRNGIFIQTE